MYKYLVVQHYLQQHFEKSERVLHLEARDNSSSPLYDFSETMQITLLFGGLTDIQGKLEMRLNLLEGRRINFCLRDFLLEFVVSKYYMFISCL